MRTFAVVPLRVIGCLFMKTAVIRARCTPELAAHVAVLAQKWGLQPSDIVRLAVEDYLMHYASQQSPLRRAEPKPEIQARSDALMKSIAGKAQLNEPPHPFRSDPKQGKPPRPSNTKGSG